jgi:DNA repair protein RadC
VGKTHVFPREIIKEALFLNANAVMLAHNHPSGNLAPSKSDIEITAQIQQGLGLMDLKVLDHVIAGGNQAVSLLEMGKMPVVQASIDTIPIGDRVYKYRRPPKLPSIKQQLKLAEEQLSRETQTAISQRKTHNRGDR